MNWMHVETKWDEFHGLVRRKWARLTENDVLAIEGKLDRLKSKLCERYGYAEDEAAEEIEQFFDSADTASPAEKVDEKIN
jgi:uncharacterized protein YjbJ (UPF0337 family)